MTVTAAPEVSGRIAELFDTDLRQSLIELRRAIHADPELSFQEERTAQKLERALARVPGATVRRVAKTGVVARIRGRDTSAPLVAIRGDIDALPVREETGLPFDVLSDIRRDTIRAYGVWHRIGIVTWDRARPALFLIEPDASIRRSWIGARQTEFPSHDEIAAALR